MATVKVDTSKMKTAVKELRAGDEVILSGYIYTVRDAAHKKIFELL